jgi:iron complex transport system permease protein
VSNRGRIALIGAVALAACAVSVFVGGSSVSPSDVVRSFTGRAGGDVTTIVLALRLPRLCIAVLVGAALAVAGFLLQGLVRNPLVDPFLTGISAGAAAAVAIAVALGAAAVMLPPIGFAAGLVTALTVAMLARKRDTLDAERLILAGVSLSALFSAFVALVLTRMGASSNNTVLAWLAGSLAGRGWSDIVWTMPYLVAGFVLAFACAKPLNALRLGNNVATAVGIDVKRTSWIVLGAATLLTAAAVSLSGVVGFVGLIVPHIVRRIVGTDARAALPACALLGAALVALADALSRSLLPPMEIPLGVVLAIVGVPAFLYLYTRPATAGRLWGT